MKTRNLGLLFSFVAGTALALTGAACSDDDYEPQREDTDALCTDGLDNDGDGDIDCADSDCADLMVCTETDCENGIDDEGDGLTDCQDPDCQSTAVCRENTSTRCQNSIDDDGDGLTDCEDPDCQDFAFCEPKETDCNNGLDDDGDGLTDCDDPDCEDLPVCGGFCYNLDFDRPGTFGMAITEANDDEDPNEACVQYDVTVDAIGPQPNTQVCLYLDGTAAGNLVACADPNVTNPMTFENVDLCQGNHSLFAQAEQGTYACEQQRERMDVLVYEDPSCQVTFPANLSTDPANPTLVNTANQTFEVTTSGARAELYINGSMRPSQDADTNGIVTFTDAPLGADGSVEVYAICHNPGAGNGDTTSIHYHLDKDTVAPDLQITSPTTDQSFGDGDCPITVTVTGVEAGQQVCAQVQGSSPGTNGCSSASTGPSDSINLEVECVNGDPVTLEAATDDAHGNQATATVDVVIDQSAPSVLIQSPVANQIYNKSDDTIDSGTDALEMDIVACTDNSYNPSNITLTVDGIQITSITPTVQAASCNGLTHTITWSAPFAFSQAVSGLQTPHDVQVTVSDGINQGQGTVSFHVDTIAPVLDANCGTCQPAQSFYRTSDDNCAGMPMEVPARLSVSGLETGLPVSLSVTSGGNPVGSPTYSATSITNGGQWLSFATPCGVELQAGQNLLTWTATDQAGNSAVPATKSVSYGAGSITSPMSGALLSVGDDCDAGGDYGISVTVQIDHAAVANGTEIEVFASSNNGSWSHPAPGADVWLKSCTGAPCTHTFCVAIPSASPVEQTDIALSLSIASSVVPGGPENITVDITEPPPATAPGMTVVNRRAAQLELSWTSVEDALTGVLQEWDVRCAENGSITADWASAMQFAGEPVPAAAGTGQTMLVAEDTSGNKIRAGNDYECGIRGRDVAGLWSPILTFPAVDQSDIGFEQMSTTIQGYTRISSYYLYWSSVEAGGDLNGDNYDDLLVGYGVGSGATNPGHGAAVYFGSATGPSGANMLDITCADDTFGGGMAGLGDFDGDPYSAGDPVAYPDIAVGAGGQDRVYIFRGHSNFGSGALDCANADITIVGPVGSYFGNTVSAIGDFDDDGYNDIAIGAPTYNSYGGAVWIVFGRPEASYPVTINLNSGGNADGAIMISGLTSYASMGMAGGGPRY